MYKQQSYPYLVVILAATLITAVVITTYQVAQVQAKSRSLFTAIGNIRDRGINEGAAAFRAGLPNSPSCPFTDTASCVIYNDAFHKGWNDAQEVAP